MGVFGKKDNGPLGEADQARVVEAIQQAESRTSGEIRVFMEKHCRYVEALDRAREVFQELGMQQTAQRNAVLIYIAWKDHQFALYGDEQVFSLSGGPAFWKESADLLRLHLAQGQMADGLVACVEKLGDVLARYFPYDPRYPRNELPDEIVFGHQR